MEKLKWIDLENKSIIVTGGSMGIGEAIVDDLVNCGAKVAIFDVNKPSKQYNENVIYFNVDIRNKEEIENAVSKVVKEFGSLDALVNDAAITRPRMLVDYYGEAPQYELNDEDFDAMVSINMKGTFIVTQAVARYLFKQQSGVVINLSSTAGLNGSRAHSCYAATKAAIHSFTLSWSKELGPYNVRVVGVAPDIMDRTPGNNDEKYRAQSYGRGKGLKMESQEFFENYKDKIPMGRPGHLSEVADLVCFLISDHASYITGITIPVSGGRTKGC